MDKVIYYLLLVTALLCATGACVLLIMSIMGDGNLVLTIALGLTAIGNALNFIAQKKKKSKNSE